MTISFQELSSAEDLQIIRDLAADVWPKTFAPILSGEQIAYMMDMMYAPEVMNKELADNMYFELLRIDSEPAGYMVYSAYNHSRQTAKLHKLYLKHAFHGIALGQKMLDHVQTQCRKLGFSELILAVNKQNERAIKAYKRNGFATFESVCNPIGNGFFMDDYLMKKSL